MPPGNTGTSANFPPACAWDLNLASEREAEQKPGASNGLTGDECSEFQQPSAGVNLPVCHVNLHQRLLVAPPVSGDNTHKTFIFTPLYLTLCQIINQIRLM